LKAADAAIHVAMQAEKARQTKKTPKVQKRRVSAEYSQIHLEPDELDATEFEQVYFQEETDSARGMSLFATKVGIATPSETDYVDAEITIAECAHDAPGSASNLTNVVQAVEFPLIVRGPLVLRSVSGDEQDAFNVAAGSYSVLARFFAKKAPRASAAAGLRVFKLALTFHRSTGLSSAKTHREES
jgi:hypothetical protein